MRLTTLQRRAVDIRVSDAALGDALDSDDPKASLIAAIADPEVDSASGVPGSGTVSSSADAEVEPASAVSQGLSSSSVTDAASEEHRSEPHSVRLTA